MLEAERKSEVIEVFYHETVSVQAHREEGCTIGPCHPASVYSLI